MRNGQVGQPTSDIHLDSFLVVMVKDEFKNVVIIIREYGDVVLPSFPTRRNEMIQSSNVPRGGRKQP